MNGLLAFLVVMALVIATVFLGRSLFSHLRKVPPSFDSPQQTGGTDERPGPR